jgi:prohibitin 2
MTVVALKTKPDAEPTVPRKRVWSYYRRHALTINVSVLMALLLIVAGWQWIVVTVPAGSVAVRYYRFAGGTDTQKTFGEGSHLKFPWDKMAIYQVRMQQGNRSFDILTRDGLTATVTISCRFHLSVPAVGWLHSHIGPEYMETLIAPAIGSYARLVISRNSTDELYSERRAEIQDEIKRAVALDLVQRTDQKEAPGGPAVVLDDVLILGIRFPPAIQAAIDRKMEQYQLREEYNYRIQREELESTRKEIEARGIARFQNVVGPGISNNYLRWKAIDATLALAQSSNTKVVVIGNGKDGVPFFLNGEEANRPPAASGDADAAQLRAQTPLSGPVATASEQAPAADGKSVPWTSWLTSRIGALLRVPPRLPPSERDADQIGVSPAPDQR